MIWQFIGAFCVMFALDFVWARYTAAMVEKHAAYAGLYGAGIVVLNGFVTLLYVATPVLLIPACLGAFAGTYIAIRWGHK